MTLVLSARPPVPASSTAPCKTISDPPAGTPVAVTVSCRSASDDRLADPIGQVPSTARFRLAPAPNFDRDPHHACPAASAATRSAVPVLAAHADVTQLLVMPAQPLPKWSSLVPLPVRKTALRERMFHSDRWCPRSTPSRRL